MKTPDTILLDLRAGQATADSIAGRLRVPCLVIEAMLKRHAKSGLVLSGTVADTLTVWRLTPDGVQATKDLLPAKSRSKRTRNVLPQFPENISAS